MMPRVFISHSSRDREFAGLLIDLLRSALNLRAEDIRCTSVEGHRLAGGADTDRELLREIKEAEVFIGLISTSSVESAYVLFELGARWGAEKHLLPLLKPGADTNLLRGPLTGINALDCASSADLHQTVRELGNLLNIDPESPSVYQRRLDEILAAVARETEVAGQEVEEPNNLEPIPPNASGHEEDEFLGAAEIIEQHCQNEWPDDFNMKAYCIEEQEKALAELRRGRPADVPEEVFSRIRQKCAIEWPDDFNMRHYCEEEQIKAFRKLRSR